MSSRIIESEFVKLEETSAKPDYIVDFNDYLQVPIENGKYTILVSKYRLSLNYLVLNAGKKIGLELGNTAEEISSGRKYIGNISYEKAIVLNKELGSFTLNIRYFLDFLKVLRSGNAIDGLNQKVDEEELFKIYKEIIEIREPTRSEWIESSYIDLGGELYISFNRFSDNKFKPLNVKLDDKLLFNKEHGLASERNIYAKRGNFRIELEDLIDNSDFTGLPTKDIKKGQFIYWSPVKDSVTEFCVDLNGAYLYCDIDPAEEPYEHTGIRQAFIMEKR